MSVDHEDMIGYAQELDLTRASYSSSRPASMERQTKLAHLKLVSKYYGYANFSYPRPDGTLTRNPYRRAGQTYSSEDLTQDFDHIPRPQTPTRRDRSSIGSQNSDGSSAPSLIDDRTDSEVSLDDDYQYHATASQLWDTFWPAEEDPSRQTPEKSKTQYPALIPSPHIRRAKKTGCIDYGDNPLPPRPVEYNIKVNNPTPPPKNDPMTVSQPHGGMRDSHVLLDREIPSSPPEPRRTIRAVRSSYSLFPRTQPQAPNYPPPPPPRAPFLKPTPSLSNLRRGTRPPPIHLHSLPAEAAAPMQSPATASLCSPLYSPLYSPVPSYERPHTSHGTYYPSTTDLTHPRSAPLPPQTPVTNTTPVPKSFFDFDSDSDSDDPEPEHTISRLVKTLHKRTASEVRRSTKGAAFADAQLRRARADSQTDTVPDSPVFFERQERQERQKRGGAVFGRMFRGRSYNS
ncbi:hypothetical protein CkaCkLH20_03166 [Colletotrichum karsti]|uniref:Uncharacterized protein n=1 Tax=Colletotrichum karsti TaxID=1095194 RepID=A0A9P6I9G1_9PEZI|nr:uncharacterized protein CkaCkLH20_03166 [Colletotrichum karsti]KAF9879623.1 hypothetical protein CkaCkLH20_03166 [Colletotrichum karsti]